MNKLEQSEIHSLGRTDDIELQIPVQDPNEETEHVKMPLFYLKFFMEAVVDPKKEVKDVLKEYLILFRKDFYDL